jgi:hypothetical protein
MLDSPRPATNLIISETDEHGLPHGHRGFDNKVQQALNKLASEEPGRNLWINVSTGPMKVTIRPSMVPRSIKEAATTRKIGNEIFIEIDTDITDESFLFYDPKGGKIKDPFYVIVAHELIHAYRIAHSEDVYDRPATSAKFPNLEEERTVNYENIIRKSFGESDRPAYEGVDTRGMEGPPDEIP